MKINILPNEVLVEVFPKLDNLGILRDNAFSVLFVLFALYESDYEVLDTFDNDNQNKRALLLYKDLELKGLIETTEELPVHYQLTAIGDDFVEYIKDELAKVNIPVTTKDFANSLRDEQGTSLEWINDYLDMWPTKSNQGYFLKGDKAAIATKMLKFIEKYGYNKETIFAATKQYLSEREEVNFDFTKKVSNFILHTELTVGRPQTSDLAVYCENVLTEAATPRKPDAFNAFI